MASGLPAATARTSRATAGASGAPAVAAWSSSPSAGGASGARMHLGHARHVDPLGRQLARGGQDGDRLVLDAAGAEGQRLARRRVEPVGVVEDDQHRRVGRDRADQAQGGGVGGEAVRRSGRSQRQSGAEGGALGRGDARGGARARARAGPRARRRRGPTPTPWSASGAPGRPLRRGRRPRAGPSCRCRGAHEDDGPPVAPARVVQGGLERGPLGGAPDEHRPIIRPAPPRCPRRGELSAARSGAYPPTADACRSRITSASAAGRFVTMPLTSQAIRRRISSSSSTVQANTP